MEISRVRVVVIASALLLLSAGAATAETVFSPGADPALDAQMRVNTRMFYAFHALPFGIGLTANYRDEAALDAIRAFLAQDDSDDVELVTGSHPYELLGGYEGPSGIGLRGGGAAIGTAFRYMALKAEGAPSDELVSARRDVVRALSYLHVVHAVTGVSWGMARGAMLRHALDPDGPPLPHNVPELQPLFDENGDPYPPNIRDAHARADNSGGELPDGLWYWVDDCSKDQLVGWVAAMATLYDAAKDDPDIDQALVTQLEDDAREVGAGLRAKRSFPALDGHSYDYDLLIIDADGTPTEHYDLNPLVVEGVHFPLEHPTSYNVFNLMMGLGIVKGLYHVSGDPEAEAFLYDELLRARDYLDWIPVAGEVPAGALDYTYNGASTNFSNVNMMAISLFLNVWFERDPDVLARLRGYVETRWWDVDGVAQSAKNLKQPYFFALYEAMTATGSDPARTAEVAALLKAFTLDPYTEEQRVNCDEAELAAGVCTAIDGETQLTIRAMSSWGGDEPVATEALDPSIRPPSNFNARSNPFSVNGGGGTGLDPGGDLHAAYWLLRYLPLRAPGETASSPNARAHRPVLPQPSEPDVVISSDDIVSGTVDVDPLAEDVAAPTPEDSASAADTATITAGGGGGSCAVSSTPSAPSGGVTPFVSTVLLLFGMAALRGRRSRAQGSESVT